MECVASDQHTVRANSSNVVFLSNIAIMVPSGNLGQKRLSSKLNEQLDMSSPLLE